MSDDSAATNEVSKQLQDLGIADGREEPETTDPEELRKQQNELLALLKQPSMEQLQQMKLAHAAELMKTGELAALQGGTAAADHKFWNTQPVLKGSEVITEENMAPIDEPKTVADIRKEPYALPPGFEWCTLDVTNEVVLKETYDLLSENYVEDDDNMFRFAYKADFLLWALTPPGYYPDWLVGLRASKSGKLVACIMGTPATIRVYGKTIRMCEINFLCVHKRLRSKRLAPVLIKEVTRRVNLEDIWQAAYTAGVVLPKPMASCRYFHRSINPKKLIDIRFSHLGPRMTMARTVKLHALPDSPMTPGIRPLELRDVPAACKLLNSHLDGFGLRPHFSEEELAHWLIPRPGVINTYVVEDPATKVINALTSFYHLPSTVIGHDKHKMMYAAYSYYHVAGPHKLEDILHDALIFAKQEGIDVFNSLAAMDNSEDLLTRLKFGPGDGCLQYYLYNWAAPSMGPEKIGLILL